MNWRLDQGSILAVVEARGFAIVENALYAAEVAALIAALERAGQRAGIQRRGGVFAIRNLLEVVPEVAELARSRAVRDVAEEVLGMGCYAVRGILFDKTPETNWKVAWHQDLTIAVRARREVASFGPWSEKAGVVSVQPTVSVLERMVTIRINLDHCGPDNGPVRVLPGSHRGGRLSPAQIEKWRRTVPEVVTTALSGSALVLRPLLLHASSPSTNPAHRRVIHLDYACDELPGDLEWYTRV